MPPSGGFAGGFHPPKADAPPVLGWRTEVRPLEIAGDAAVPASSTSSAANRSKAPAALWLAARGIVVVVAAAAVDGYPPAPVAIEGTVGVTSMDGVVNCADMDDLEDRDKDPSSP